MPTHKITFDAAGGDVTEETREVAEGAAYGTLPTPTKDGYTFNGWKDGSTTVSASTIMGTSNVRLTADWTQKKHSITFDYNDGTGKKESREVAEGAEYGTLPTATRSGYTFNGWRTTGGGNVSASDKMGSSDVTLLANWTQIKSHNISYNYLEGTTHSNPTSFVEGASIIILSSPSSRTGYSFNGWYDNAKLSGGAYVTEIDPSVVNSDVAVYAVWKSNEYPITYTGIDGATSNPNPSTYYYDNGTVILAEPSKDGFNFEGWYLNGTKVSSFDSKNLNGITLEARWTAKPITYTVTFVDFNLGYDTYTITKGSSSSTVPAPAVNPCYKSTGYPDLYPGDNIDSKLGPYVTSSGQSFYYSEQ